jgi:hypothetical protein
MILDLQNIGKKCTLSEEFLLKGLELIKICSPSLRFIALDGNKMTPKVILKLLDLLKTHN